jgi:large subunit ribosomal protein L15
MDLTKLEKLNSMTRGKKRVGRGIGCGKGGHTSGRGHKGQKARKGNKKPWLGFEGGQVPLYKRLPRMNGFKVKGKVKSLAISLALFNYFENGSEVTPEMLLQKKLISYLPKSGIKVVSNGELDKKVILKGFAFSASALARVEKAGATIVKDVIFNKK